MPPSWNKQAIFHFKWVKLVETGWGHAAWVWGSRRPGSLCPGSAPDIYHHAGGQGSPPAGLRTQDFHCRTRQFSSRKPEHFRRWRLRRGASHLEVTKNSWSDSREVRCIAEWCLDPCLGVAAMGLSPEVKEVPTLLLMQGPQVVRLSSIAPPPDLPPHRRSSFTQMTKGAKIRTPGLDLSWESPSSRSPSQCCSHWCHKTQQTCISWWLWVHQPYSLASLLGCFPIGEGYPVWEDLFFLMRWV